mmetsp:Transcript_26408/g.41282  ORF Transcript_26408/g.41282 Transcript_26408/m.41282 type:complete len:230 (+) Transcript_26408:82-771(+)
MELISTGQGTKVSGDRVRELFSSTEGTFKGGMLHREGGRIHPAKVTQALASSALQKGLSLHLNCLAQSIEPLTDSEFRVDVLTKQGKIKAKWVMVCTNVLTPKLLPELEAFMTQDPSEVLVFESGPEVWKHPFTADEDKWYGQQLPDGRIVLGGPSPSASESEGPEEFALKAFPFLESRRVESRWQGVICETPDELPLVGEVPGRPGVLVCGGFNGHGMPVCYALASGF